ncbi:dihydrodipicolinate synthase [Naematelia encephala]|uniref:Dihydrodipicolinate synthase n=1 Tax=Naematelia encephala TaxID=71784 RepID=A0A1Y2BLY5_9TREE|nr:dihydrodipicolinate synthase [Naematelia encephala]
MTTTNGTTNGSAAPHRLWANGPSVPLTTPFVAGGEEVDHEALAKQVVRIAKAGLGIVLLGTTGEASHMSHSERKAATATARKALDDAGLTDVPLCVGTGGGSLKTTIELCNDAAEAGASHCIVICPGYFSFAMGRDKTAILGFFKGVFDRSPLPVMIYNFPGAASGIDLNSDDISELAEHPNCFGVKLTCGAVGKGQRIATYTQTPEYLARRGNSLKASTVTGQFQVLPGFSESLLPTLLGRHTGCITGTGGIIPKTVRKLYDTAVKGLQGDSKALSEAVDLQEKVAAADWISIKTGVQGTKYALDTYIEKNLGGDWRSPLGPLTPAVKEMIDVDLKPFMEFEASL